MSLNTSAAPLHGSLIVRSSLLTYALSLGAFTLAQAQPLNTSQTDIRAYTSTSVTPLQTHPPHTHLAAPPLSATLRCITCPLKPKSIPSEHVITLELNIVLVRALRIPLKLTLNALPSGWRLKDPLPSSLLTRGQRTSFRFDLVVNEEVEDGADEQSREEAQPDVEQLRLTLAYQSKVSGLSHTLTFCSNSLYSESTCKQERYKRARAPRPTPLRAPLLRFRSE